MSSLHKVRLQQRAFSQHGLVTRAQASDIGLHDRYLSRTPEWTRVRPGLYRLTAYPTGWRQDVMAAVLVGGPGTVASHRAASMLHGLDGVRNEVVEITLGPRGQTRSLTGVVVHRSAPIERTDRTRRDHIPVTSVTRTLLDLGGVLGVEGVETALESALRHNWTSTSLLRQRLGVLGGRGRPGTAALRQALARRLEAPPTGSELETRFVQLCRRARLPGGVRQAEVLPARARVDFAWAAERVLVELDGYAYHGSPADHRRDMRRQNAVVMVRSGWAILHYGWDDVVHHEQRVAHELRRVLQHREVSFE